MDALQGRLSVSTTSDTWDPYAIMLARDIIKLMSRNVPIESAIKVFDEGITSEIVQVCIGESTSVYVISMPALVNPIN